LAINHSDFRRVMKILKEIQKEVEDLEKRVSDAAWKDNPGMGMERDF